MYYFGEPFLMMIFNIVYVYVAGPFTRPHPAIWRIVFGQYFLVIARRKSASIFYSVNMIFNAVFYVFSLYLHFRSECPLLPVPGFYHLPQLAAGKATDVLAGPKPALCKERGRHNGEYQHTQKTNPFSLHFVMAFCAALYRNML